MHQKIFIDDRMRRRDRLKIVTKTVIVCPYCNSNETTTNISTKNDLYHLDLWCHHCGVKKNIPWTSSYKI